jgi:hypothetical protein
MSLGTSLAAPATRRLPLLHRPKLTWPLRLGHGWAFAFPDMLRTESRLPSAKGTDHDFRTQYTRGDRNNAYQQSSHLMTLLVLALSFIPWWGWLLLVLVVLIAIMFD